MVRAVPRDLLPLPPDLLHDTLPEKQLARPSAQRLGKSTAVRKRLNECVMALNWMWGAGEFLGVRPSEAQFSALDSIRQSIWDDVPPEGWTESPEASLSAMLGSRNSVYDHTEGPTCVATLEPSSEVSWPSQAGVMPLCTALPAAEADRLLDVHTRLMRSSEDFKELVAKEGRPAAYWDESLRSDPDRYASFVRELLRRDMVILQEHQPLESAGLLFVPKKRRHAPSYL